RRRLEFPARSGRPISILELVLDIEQPDADRRGEQDDRQAAEQEGDDPQRPGDEATEEDNHRVGAEDADPSLALAERAAGGDAVAHQEEVDRPDAEHDERMAIEPIGKASPSRTRQILANR